MMVSMNRLSGEKRRQVVGCLVEGMSIRATVRVTGVAKNTIVRLLVDLGAAASEYLDRALVNLPCERIQVDEIWSFVGAKDKNLPPEKQGRGDVGSVWTFVALDADTKLVPSWFVGPRDYGSAAIFLMDLHRRLASRVQLTTDGWGVYPAAVEDEFGADVDYAIVVKEYGSDSGTTHADTKYSPGRVLSCEFAVKQGDPDMAHASTSYVERQNLTMRMGMRRFTRLTNAFSKKIENHAAAVSLHFAYYNLCRPHQTLSKPYPRTPAMAAGVEDHVWSLDELVALLEVREGEPQRRQ